MKERDTLGDGAEGTLRKLLPKLKASSIDISLRDRIEAERAGGVLTKQEQTFEWRQREQVIREKDEEIEQHQEERHMRKIALLLLFIFMSVWSGLIFLTYWICDTSDAVSITLFTTTLGQVLGLTTIALRWLFPKR
ncbi:MAG: TMEM43 family protein [Lentisphaeraceae bacterium]|nr:TMEM43 family protein [Lentisphaeraceae bacterium]